MKSKLIDHITQPCSKSCQSACMAMLTGLPVEKLIDRHHEDLISGNKRFHEICTKYGVEVSTPEDLENIFAGSIYVLIVSSGLLTELHMIIVDARNAEDIRVYDPATCYRQSINPGEGEVLLRSFVVRYRVDLAPHLGVL
ncbi:UNVERIFIED_ORG: hypothetical protein GCAPEGMB_00414 [Vibrio phage V07]